MRSHKNFSQLNLNIVAVDPIVLFPEHRKILQRFGMLTIPDTIPKNNQEIIRRIQHADIVLDFWTALPKEVILKLTQTTMICCASAGYDWVDIKTAIAKGITVTHCPGHNAESVAEHTIGLMLSALRLSSKAARDAKQGIFTPDVYKGKDLKNSVVGIIGYGTIGKRVGDILTKGFGAKVLYMNSSSSRKDFKKLLTQSDVISINAALNDQTKGMIGFAEFELMKPGVVLVNTGRGAIIDEDAFVTYIKNGKIFATGIDTLSKEPFDANHPLLSLSNVLVTPHIGWNTEETEYRLSAQVVEIVTAFLEHKPRYVISEEKSFIN